MPKLILACCVVAAIVVAGAAYGTKAMTPEQLIEALRRLDPEKRAEFDQLALAVRNQSRELGRSAVTVWKGTDVRMSDKAALLIAQIGDLGIVPLLEATDIPGVAKPVWMLRNVVEAEMVLREKIRERIDSMFDDKNPVPMPRASGQIEEPPVPRRVCDEAYILMRRLLNSSESQMNYLMNVRAFLSLGEQEKNKEIQKARQTRTWTMFVETIE